MSETIEFTGRKSFLLYLALLILLLAALAVLITAFAPPSDALPKGHTNGGGPLDFILQWLPGRVAPQSPVSHSGA